MTPMRRSQNWLPYVFNDLFDNDWMIKANSTAPAINVIESEKDYRVEVAAPGMTKDDFNIRIDENDNLVVSMEKKEEKNEIDFRGIRINNDTREFYFNEKKIELTKTEFAILWELCLHKGNVVKSDDLFLKVWGEDYYKRDNNTIMVHIRHLRQKIEKDPTNPEHIKTIWGKGYYCE